MESFSSSDGAAATAWGSTLKNPSQTPKGSFFHRSERIAWRGDKAHKACAGKRSHGSLQVLPRGLARKCPVDIFAEAAISKEYLPAEDRSHAGAWASLGVPE
ncbi:hypothetical protein [Desulfosporosinus shakirovi]|uniref:hypothetical protein n=1 Tax=Desulfosporosinus shakirovi TaxID=2885154 RepID=UPI001E289D93|nr:hypothetical protein [Desulfosporosinus sp. SRJS8]MCB8814632.1 hypothetical protein [Desulfosporosinus sp. SRJS8]